PYWLSRLSSGELKFPLATEGAPVSVWTCANDSVEAFTECGRGSESHFGGNLFNRMARRLQQLLCAPDAGLKDPLQGSCAGLLGEPSAERACTHRCMTRKALQRERLVKMRVNPSH